MVSAEGHPVTKRSLWLAISLTSLASALCILFGHIMTEPSALTEFGATMMLGQSFVTFLHWIALGDQKRRRRDGRRLNLHP